MTIFGKKIFILVMSVMLHLGILPIAQAQLPEWKSPSLFPTPLILSAPYEFRGFLGRNDNNQKQNRISTMGSVHKYLGYGTLVLAAATAFSSSSENTHEALAYTATTAATLTCITGFMEYSDYFDLDEGWSDYNIHIAAGVTATAGFIITTILGANDEDHGGIGGGSAVLMCVPVIVLKW